MATTLERATFANQVGAHINLKVLAIGTIAVGNTLTITTTPLTGSKIATVIVEKLLPFGSLGARVVTTPVSGILLFPLGSGVA